MECQESNLGQLGPLVQALRLCCPASYNEQILSVDLLKSTRGSRTWTQRLSVGSQSSRPLDHHNPAALH